MTRIEKLKALSFTLILILILYLFMYNLYVSFTGVNKWDEVYKLKQWKGNFLIYVIITMTYFTFRHHLIQKKSFAILFVIFLFIQVLLEYLKTYFAQIEIFDFIANIILIAIMSFLSLTILIRNSSKKSRHLFSSVEFLSLLIMVIFDYLDKLLNITNYQLSFIINMSFISIWVISIIINIIMNKKLYSTYNASSNWLHLIQGEKIIGSSTPMMAVIMLTTINIFTGSKTISISGFEIILISAVSAITLILIILFIFLKKSQVFLIGSSSLITCFIIFFFMMFYKYESLLESLINSKILFVTLFVMSSAQIPFIKFYSLNGNYKIKLLSIFNKILIILIFTVFGYYLFFDKMTLLKMQTPPFDLLTFIAILTLPLINGITYMSIWLRRSSLIVK